MLFACNFDLGFGCVVYYFVLCDGLIEFYLCCVLCLWVSCGLFDLLVIC